MYSNRECFHEDMRWRDRERERERQSNGTNDQRRDRETSREIDRYLCMDIMLSSVMNAYIVSAILFGIMEALCSTYMLNENIDT